MHNSAKIKVCGLTRLEDVQLALSLGADFCGFIVYPNSPRAVSFERAVELASHVPAGKRVLVDVETPSNRLKHLHRSCFDFFQIHTKPNIDKLFLTTTSETLSKERLWLAPRLSSKDFFAEELTAFAETILLDAYQKDLYGGTGHIGDWSRFNQLSSSYPQTNWVLAGGLNPTNVLEAQAATGARILDINSGVESSPGFKDANKLRQLFQILKPN
ncbi:MAG: phosphoribosylanthranilate isomerase [Verrucomicrobiota bacterium]|nr:phosphoribosylanthranilate isomerase [Verrucomicrobiota bacterium]